MSKSECHRVTHLIQRLGSPHVEVVEELRPLVYDALPAGAGALLVRQPPRHTLPPTFAAVSVPEIATLLDVTPRTVQLDLRSAGADLRRVLEDSA